MLKILVRKILGFKDELDISHHFQGVNGWILKIKKFHTNDAMKFHTNNAMN